MTDNEITKALECWCERHCKILCTKAIPCERCIVATVKNALDLINRLKSKNQELEKMIVTQRGLIDYQKAEIERLLEDVSSANDEIYEIGTRKAEELADELTKAQVEAIKEFAERLTDKADYYSDLLFKVVEVDEIDNLVKELTEGNGNA